MNVIKIVAIVEGHGEVRALPELVRRIANEIAVTGKIDLESIRVPSTRLRREGELERAVELAARKAGKSGAIIILLDCDWDGACPAVDGPALLARTRAARPDMLVSVILARHEFESWFIAAAESLADRRGLAADIRAPEEAETIRDAKGWLGARIEGNRSYSETHDQAALTALFDIQAARRADSFDKCYREIERVLKLLAQ